MFNKVVLLSYISDLLKRTKFEGDGYYDKFYVFLHRALWYNYTIQTKEMQIS